MTRRGLKFVDNAANTVTSPASVDLQQGTVLMVFAASDVANVLRNVAGRTGGAQNHTAFRRSADGTSIRVQIQRGAGTPQQVDTPTGWLVAGVPTAFCYQWDIAAGTPTAYLSKFGAPLADVSTSPTAGSGTHNAAGATWQVGGSQSAGMTVWAFAVSSVRLSIAEMNAWQRDPMAPLRGAVVQWVADEGSAGLLTDLTQNNLHGTISGAKPTSTQIALSGRMVRRSPGYGATSSDVTVALTGVSTTTAVGTSTPGSAVGATGASSTTAPGSLGVALSRAITGSASTASPGTVAGATSLVATGVSSTGALGTLAPSTTVGLTGSASSTAVGNVTAPGNVTVALTGVASTTAVGSVGHARTVATTGAASTTAAGTLGRATTVGVTGSSTTGAIGSFGVTKSGSAALTGVVATGAAGSVSVAAATQPAVRSLSATVWPSSAQGAAVWPASTQPATVWTEG